MILKVKSNIGESMDLKLALMHLVGRTVQVTLPNGLQSTGQLISVVDTPLTKLENKPAQKIEVNGKQVSKKVVSVYIEDTEPLDFAVEDIDRIVEGVRVDVIVGDMIISFEEVPA